ncbi:hypothetical protein GCM10010399_69940 [Dactylosporangium fulvum]|uniref:DUF2470 domain-containing protein n=1 Tax=Dactylosporangium fulvum TaxID=53359 RepID=A0ABY5W3B6_9ACTN|nr:DUF2470 domain-containing protein [Dactylosporangium fulvum]UWP83596.1 DUF2470 domain-containing protein [Dactylosporangium fulvum]
MPVIKLPTAAERLRSLLTAASSLTLNVPGHRCDLVGRHRVDRAGRIVLELPDESHVAHLVRAEPDLAAAIELTDLIATPVRVYAGVSRVRARATFSGWLTPTATEAGELLAVMELGSATLLERGFGGDEVDVEADEFAAARPDPLAEAEADMLCHLATAHPDAVERLSRLVPPHHLHGVHRILPVRLDRFGVVLRLEFASRARDVQLPFPAPLDRAEQAGERMQELFARARCCRPGH